MQSINKQDGAVDSKEFVYVAGVVKIKYLLFISLLSYEFSTIVRLVA